MKRFLIFAALVPPVALAIFLAPEATAASTIGFIFMTLAYVYPIGLVPASMTAAVDWSLSGQSIYLRMAVTVLFAILLAELIARQLLGVSGSPKVWLMGAIPAALCSWLAGRKPV
ncbi:hypothetical protein RPMA_16710 [Tardiphaga alba]|uniref:Uncharacterized protein n=1 Tax=Tardiphaga alba TaxID=340268 RepID=A0ABX8ACE5_9BRAD|nr:hypothetical protein [Tardiphaga alba]QUS40294.1 hypothetical protein RPMA_16710 [Tardiphaga alba]